jgi:hypothetical protein
MGLTVGSISVLSASINENLNCRTPVDTALAQVSRVTSVSRVSVPRRSFLSAERALFLRGRSCSLSRTNFSEDTTGLGCRLCRKGQKKLNSSHNSIWQASAVAEFSGTDLKDIDSSAGDDLSNSDAAVYIIKEYALEFPKT